MPVRTAVLGQAAIERPQQSSGTETMLSLGAENDLWVTRERGADRFRALAVREPRQGRASSTRLNGVAVARRKRVKPPWRTTSPSRRSPACAPSAAAPSWLSEAGTHSWVEKA